MQANKTEVTRLLKTARGQIDGLIRMVEEDRYCIDISNQLLSTQALLGTINAEVLTAHVDHCVRQAFESGDAAEEEKKIAELQAVLKRLSKWRSQKKASCRSKTISRTPFFCSAPQSVVTSSSRLRVFSCSGDGAASSAG